MGVLLHDVSVLVDLNGDRAYRERLVFGAVPVRVEEMRFDPIRQSASNSTAAQPSSGYSSLRQARGSAGGSFGVRSSRKEKYGATNGSGADTVYVW
jgi:hypothetical protein